MGTMESYHLILTLAMGFSLALALGYVTQRLKLSPIVGYLLAGVVVSPFTPGLVADADLANQLAEVGVILLMFGVGLHFHLKDLWAVRKVALPGAVGQSLLATALGALVAHALGWNWAQGIVIGIAVSVASTVVLVRVLTDNELLDSERGHIAVGWLIVEDLFTVLVLVLLPALAAASSGGPADPLALLGSLGLALLKIGLLAAIVLLGGGRLIPWLLEKVAKTRSRELFTLSVLAFALVIAAVSALAFGASMALGAFLAGMVVGQSKMSEQAAADALPFKDAFAVLFFVSVGMLFDPSLVLSNLPLFLALMGIILVAKPLGAFLIVMVLGYPVGTALTVAGALAQIGEFSFILSSEASRLDLIPKEGASVLVAAALVSIALNPLLFKGWTALEGALRGNARLWAALGRRSERRGRALNESGRALAAEQGGRVTAVIVGFGPVGRTAAGLLASFGVRSVVVDLNIETISTISQGGGAAVYGDASKAEILEAAGIKRAKYLIVTLPDLAARIKVIMAARRLNAELKIFSRARYLTERESLERLGVTEVCYEEAEAAVGLAKLLLRGEGADEERIRESMARLRDSLALSSEAPIAPPKR
jgi:monovalent cation:H+ antiporter-2, CPA2 family